MQKVRISSNGLVSTYSTRTEYITTSICVELIDIYTNEVICTINAVAKWDTGATHTIVAKRLIPEKVEHFDEADTSTANGNTTSKLYKANIVFPDGHKLTMHTIFVPQTEVGGADMLIGMDIINLGDFSITQKPDCVEFLFKWL